MPAGVFYNQCSMTDSSHSPAGCTACNDGTQPDDPTKDRQVVQPDKAALLNRLRRIEGQVGGIASMVRDDRYCVDILTQLSAVRSAIDAVSIQILNTHAQGCVRRAVQDNGGAESLDELMSVIRRMIR
ncbi:metal-sensitive transcriptional regulator [Acetobacter vaccinii]